MATHIELSLPSANIKNLEIAFEQNRYCIPSAKKPSSSLTGSTRRDEDIIGIRSKENITQQHIKVIDSIFDTVTKIVSNNSLEESNKLKCTSIQNESRESNKATNN